MRSMDGEDPVLRELVKRKTERIGDSIQCTYHISTTVRNAHMHGVIGPVSLYKIKIKTPFEKRAHQ